MSGMEYGLGLFGDERLEKGGSIYMRPWFRGLARAFGDWRNETARVRCSSRAFFAIVR